MFIQAAAQLSLGCGAAQKWCVGLLYGRPEFESRPGAPMEIPLLSESDEEILSGLSECDVCVDECITVCLKIIINKKSGIGPPNL